MKNSLINMLCALLPCLLVSFFYGGGFGVTVFAILFTAFNIEDKIKNKPLP